MKIIIEYPNDENPKFVKATYDTIKYIYEVDGAKVILEINEWCQCKNPDFNGDYMDAKCNKCKGKLE